MNKPIIYKLILNWLKQANNEITKLEPSKGVFFIPEIHFVFEIGKLLKINELEVFGEKMEWLREIDLQNGGPSDLSFKNRNNEYVVFEFKIANTWHSYFKDIDKLKAIKENSNRKIKARFFVALVDTFITKNIRDERVIKLEQRSDITMPKKLEYFSVQNQIYTQDISAVLIVAEVNK